MKFTTPNLNKFIFFKVPSAYLSGVRFQNITEESCTTTVRYRWISKNPFNSIYFAILCMAAELATGALVMRGIKNSNKKISMLILNQKASFTKKAKGKIAFTCTDATLINQTIEKLITTQEPQTIWLTAKGIDQANDVVCTIDFEWTLKLYNKA